MNALQRLFSNPGYRPAPSTLAPKTTVKESPDTFVRSDATAKEASPDTFRRHRNDDGKDHSLDSLELGVNCTLGGAALGLVGGILLATPVGILAACGAGVAGMVAGGAGGFLTAAAVVRATGM